MFAHAHMHNITPHHTTQGQYVFLHDAILEGYTSGDTEIVVGKLGKRMTELEAVDDEGISGFRKEFEVNNNIMYVRIDLMHPRSIAILRAGYFMDTNVYSFCINAYKYHYFALGGQRW